LWRSFWPQVPRRLPAERPTPLTDRTWDDYDLENWAQKPDSVWVEATQAGEKVVELEFTVYNYDPDDLPKSWHYSGVREGTVTLKCVDVDLAAWDLGSQVTEQSEEDPGAFIHYNVDNDNANTSGGEPIADATEVGPVSGENDTEAVIASTSPAVGDGAMDLKEGTLVLRRTGSKLRVWTHPQKGTGNKILVDGDSKTWDLSVEAQRNAFNAVRAGLRAEGYQDGTSSLRSVRDEDHTQYYGGIRRRHTGMADVTSGLSESDVRRCGRAGGSHHGAAGGRSSRVRAQLCPLEGRL